MEYLKETVFYGNSLFKYLIALVLFISSFAIMRISLLILVRLLVKVNVRFQNSFFFALSKSVKRRSLPVIFVASLAIAKSTLVLPKVLGGYWGKILAVCIIVFSVLFICDVITNFTDNYLSQKKNVILSDGIITLIKVLVWIIGILTILSNVGVNVTTLITGLGIGGVAVAFAAQSIIADLFNYFVIVFDKPFFKGDFIQIDQDLGTVEYIGIKSTRIRRNTGEQLLISNTNLLASRIKNYRVLERRRKYMVLGVEYSTPLETLKKIPDLVKTIIESESSTTFSSARFVEFADSSLNFEVIYYVNVSDYTEFVTVVEKINYKIVEEFAKINANFAFPSTTVYLSKE
ncbi:mechanosensitive ion channel family protein [Brachyspira pilosicoli]|uniref:Mechanosensitive ion channel family protein n=1 Tax=Brachyspira pilosicoli TaxID=52584 RepID=A0A5C8ET39_BRAPL|nr:mechanosensitive ion channel family protein [Brachyspira pilosicoli]TXJ41209.1 mechanosensitive ion channel family protein [Brachyspira pilosicoli]